MEEIVTNTPGCESADAINQQASDLMKRGIALLETEVPANLNEAIGCFDQAIELRRTLPFDANPFFRYGLAAGWMNRGDALTRLGSADNLAGALQSYDAALEALRELSLDANPLFRRRQAIIWLNRGQCLQIQNTPATRLEAGRSFETAGAVLLEGNAPAIEDQRYLLAIARMGQAAIFASDATVESHAQARLKAKQAMMLADQAELQDLAITEVRLKARHILCRAIAQLVATIPETDPARNELFIEASDAADDGLALVRTWEQQSVTIFRPLAHDLFHFGARIYQASQPHFLSEYLLENLDPALSSGSFATDPHIQAVAIESLRHGFRHIQEAGGLEPGAPQFDDLLERLRGLRLVEERLTELRQA